MNVGERASGDAVRFLGSCQRLRPWSEGSAQLLSRGGAQAVTVVLRGRAFVFLRDYGGRLFFLMLLRAFLFVFLFFVGPCVLLRSLAMSAYGTMARVWPCYGAGVITRDFIDFMGWGVFIYWLLGSGHVVAGGSRRVLAVCLGALVGGLAFLGLFIAAVFMVTATLFTNYISSGSSARTPHLRISPGALMFSASKAPMRKDRSCFRVSTGHR